MEKGLLQGGVEATSTLEKWRWGPWHHQDKKRLSSEGSVYSLILRFLFLIGRLNLQRRMDCGGADTNAGSTCRSPKRVSSQGMHSQNSAFLPVRSQKAPPLEILGYSCGVISSLVLSSLSLKGEPVCLRTRHSRGSKIHLISHQRQTSVVSKVARAGCKLGKETSSPTENYRL